MPIPSPARGSIWSVPEVGPDARAFILSVAAGLSRGRPEYMVVPLYTGFEGEPQTSLDFRVRREETTLSEPLLAALWNARPIAAEALGIRIGESVADSLVAEIRDAYLRVADPSVSVKPGRLGETSAEPAVRRWRDSERLRWQPLTGRVLSPDVEQINSDVIFHNRYYEMKLVPYIAGNVRGVLRATSEHPGFYDTSNIPNVQYIAGSWAFSNYYSNLLEGRANRVTVAPLANYLGAQQYTTRFSALSDDLRVEFSEGHGKAVTYTIQIKSALGAGNTVAVSHRGGKHAGAA